MSYQAQANLENDGYFQQRNRACCLQQASLTYELPAQQALAAGIQKDEGGYWPCFNRMAAAGPGIADKADNGDGTVDQTKITDAELLSLTQANWGKVTELYFNADGSVKP